MRFDPVVEAETMSESSSSRSRLSPGLGRSDASGSAAPLLALFGALLLGAAAAATPLVTFAAAAALAALGAALLLPPIGVATVLVAASFLSGVALPIGGFNVRPEQVAGPLVLLACLARPRLRPLPRVTLLVVLWLFAGILGALGEPGAGRAVEHAVRLFATLLPVLLLPALLGPEESERAWDVFLGLAVLEALASLCALGSHFFLDTRWGVYEERYLFFVHPQGTLLEPNLLGALSAAAAAPLLLRSIAKGRGPCARLADAVGLIVLVGALAASVTRAAWVALPIALVLSLAAESALHPERRIARLAARAVPVVVVSLALALGTAVILAGRGEVDPRAGIAGKISSLARPFDDPNVRARLRTYTAASAIVREAPLLGAGHGAMERLPGTEDRALAWTGNLEMHLLSDTGLAGLLLIGALVGATLLGLRRAAREAPNEDVRRRAVERLSALLVLLFCAQATDTTWLASFWVLFGLALASLPRRELRARSPVLKILFVHPSDELYGSDRVLLELVRSLPRERFAPLVLLSSDVPYAGRLSRRLEEIGVPVRRMRIGVLRRQVLASPLRLLRYVVDVGRSTVAIGKLLLVERVDVVHANTVTVFPGAFAAALTGTKLVWHVHEIVTERPGRSLLNGLVAALADRLVVVSEAARDALGPAGARAELVPNGVEPRVTTAPPAPPLVAYVGRISRRKGPDVFVRAAARVAARHPDVRFVIAGDEFGGEDLTKELRREVALRSLEGRFAFRPFREDVSDLFAEASVVVSPSVLPESFGLVVLEAMAYGRPVIASALGGPRELVVDGETGFLVTPGDDAALADAIERLVTDPDLARRMGEAGRRRAAERFSLDVASTRFAALYEVLARPRLAEPRVA